MTSLISICKTAAQELASQRWLFFRLLIVPALIFIALDLLYEAETREHPDGGWSPRVLLSFILSLLISCAIAVATHRIFLLGSQSASSFSSVVFNPRLLRFVGYSILLTLIMMAVLIPFGVLAIPLLALTDGGNAYSFFIVWGLGMIFGGYVFARLAFVLPATAMDRPTSLGDAWRLSAGCRLHAFLIVIVLPFALGIPGMLTTGGPLILTVVGSCVSILALIYGISCFSVLYREVMGPLDGSSGEIPSELQ